MLNSEIVKERLKEMDENLKVLTDLKKMPLEEFLADIKSSKAAERCLEINIQSILDICHHIIAANNFPRPKNNQEAIKIIARNNIIPQELAARILPMAGLRNILIHEYIKVDPERIYGHLENLQDFREFQKHILAYVKD